MLGKGKVATKVGGLTAGALVTVTPTLAILAGALLLLVAILLVVIAISNKMSSNVERILAVLLGRDMPFRASDHYTDLPPPPPPAGAPTHPHRRRWPRMLGRRR